MLDRVTRGGFKKAQILFHFSLFCLDWFPGWISQSSSKIGSSSFGFEPSHGSNENCVEMRSAFPAIQVESLEEISSLKILENIGSDSPHLQSKFFWNDAECNNENWFLCQKVFEEKSNFLVKSISRSFDD